MNSAAAGCVPTAACAMLAVGVIGEDRIQLTWLIDFRIRRRKLLGREMGATAGEKTTMMATAHEAECHR